ncbi:zinc finger CCHC domain-containing protein 8 homolog [Hyalella azteca]|uniref:Zinc finger CCHC domain-containing protein 8 homolog n=1 Tax=Hyalella azteca TaxID=294128 RepID=A0A8B7NJ37_HYAAZ|nr:zinc finger CCHC domain-containing protein 8 homolog [Hyalella azteca]XP_047741582.1 zinc finger CCHC domain-containing protein 8 homolog [Hyalella azteca]
MATKVSNNNGTVDLTESMSDSGVGVASNFQESSTDFITLDDSEQFTLSTNISSQPACDGDSQDDGPEEVLVVPKYTTVFTDFLTVPEFSMETGKLVNDARPKRTCFNCLGDHNVTECKDPLNQSKIAQNRRAHMSRRQGSSVRYHELASNKFGHFTPGVMSPELRYALGCRPDQLSEVFYRMRLIGYPPGWLLEAREQQGEVALYGSDGRAVTMLDGEDGEVTGTAKYRPEKLIEFPGFNAPLPEQFYEEGHVYNLPPIQSQHCVHRWREIMNKNKVTPYRKRRMRPMDADNTADLETALEISAGNSDSPGGSNGQPPSASPATRPGKRRLDESPEEGEVSSDEEKNSSQSKKLKLSDDVAAAGSSLFTIDLEPSPLEESVTSPATDITAGNESTATVNESGFSTVKSDFCVVDELQTTAEGAEEDDFTDPGPPDSSSTPAAVGRRARRHVKAASKGFVMGAVLPKSITPFTSLPHPDKWTVDVTDHILFENLPDSTGAWQNMKSLMQKVKSKVSEIHAEND